MRQGDRSIKAKLHSMIVVTSAAVLSLTAVAFAVYEVATFKHSAVQNVSIMAQVVAENSAATVAFQNPDEAAHVLAALRADPDILEAVIYDKADKPFAHYLRGELSTLPAFPTKSSGYRFDKGALIYYQPIVIAGDHLGTLVLRSSLHKLYTRLQLYAVIVLVVMIGAFGIAYLISTTMQRRISRPILALAETAKTVTTNNDYSVRAPKLSADEVGQLTESFNQMLEQIQHNREELHVAHEQIQHHAEQLEKTVAERTAKLQDTIGELEAFSYSVSHDMRAPLRAMSRYAEFLKRDAGARLTQPEQQFLERILTSARRLDALIQDALTYSRVSKSELKLTSINIAPIINGIIEQYPALHPDRADIITRMPLLNVLGHEASLTQCLSNVLANAVKFVVPGKRPRIVLWTEPRGDDVRICIQDNGIGVAPEDQERIFGMFARVHSEKEYEGTGIGLAIVRKAVERMGGSLGIESDIGKGSVFWLQLKRG
jgi:signal transduction histidine kinase